MPAEGCLCNSAGIQIAGRNINNLRYADDTTLMAESEEELKSLLMRVREDPRGVRPRLEGFWGSKITADGDCSHEIKRHLLLGRNVMTKLDSILKSRDIYFVKKSLSSRGSLVLLHFLPLGWCHLHI